MSPQSIISVITFLVKKDKFFKVVNRTFDPTGSLKQNWPFFLVFFFKFLVLWCKHMYSWNALKWILKLKGRDIHLHIFCKMCFFSKIPKMNCIPLYQLLSILRYLQRRSSLRGILYLLFCRKNESRNINNRLSLIKYCLRWHWKFLLLI